MTPTTVGPPQTVTIDGHQVTLYHRGALSPAGLLERPRIAFTGARASTAYGVHVAGEMAQQAVQAGFVVISGGAYGIDGATHQGALHADGITVAVLACGVDVPYPRGHDALFQRITDYGAVVSEYPDGTPPTRQKFLDRNRIIALLATHVVVVEAALRSGSLNTARHGIELGRQVYAVPGPITSATSVGTNQLLKQKGVHVFTGIEDLVA